MKKIFTSLTLCLAVFTVAAQTVIKEMDGADTRFIPGQYMKNGEAAIYFSSNEYGYSDGQTQYEAQIFDFELKPLKSFYFQILHPYTVTESRASTGTKELTKVTPVERGEIYGFPDVADMEARKAAFISWFYDTNKYLDSSLSIEGLEAVSRIDGTLIRIPLQPNDRYSIPYRQHLKSMEVYFDSSNKYGFNYTYATVVPVCNGEWSKTTWYDVPVSNFCTPRCTDVASMNHWNGGVYLPFSQAFFNDDERFEYVRYKAEIVEGYWGATDIAPMDDDSLHALFGISDSDRDGDGEVDRLMTRFGVKRTGLEVVAEDGTVIYSFPLPETCEDNASIEFFKSDNHILAQVGFNWRNDEGRYVHTVRFYRIDKSAGVPKMIKEENHISLAPNPASKGTPVEINLPASESSRLVRVANMNGARVYATAIAPDATKVMVPTSSLASGMYLISVIENGGVIETCKVIVR